MVVISLVRSNERGRIGFLRVPNRLNVAISRARRLVVCVGDAATLRAGEETMYGRLVEAARACGGYLMATELLGGRASTRARPTRRGEASAGAPGTPQEGDPNAPARHRRRRHRHAKPLPGQTPLPAGAVAPPTTSPDGTDPSQRPRRRRHRHRSRGGWIGAPATVSADGIVATPPPAGVAGGPSEGSRRRRNRHRRRGPRPVAEAGPNSAAPPSPPQSPPSSGGGEALE